jgi:hypothetical protein
MLPAWWARTSIFLKSQHLLSIIFYNRLTGFPKLCYCLLT